MNLEDQQGFSLAELLVTMGIAALLLSVGLPGLTSFAKDARQVSVANEMLADFHYARDLAITSNARVTICPSSNGATCDGAGWEDGRIVFVDTDGNLALNGAETVQRVTGDIGDVDVNTAEFGASITYRPNGRAMANIVRNNTGEFVVCDDRGSAHARALIVDMSGRPRISHEDSSGLPPTCP
ncbi:MAG: prepilin-type N-terminal cleavage/methylation domain-containing protein [Gammaproteobacteria bacterium]|nr:prepilin-type N-terminal cleavage/methylation domain-containing protein [Gammaproteobacteria bacterium]